LFSVRFGRVARFRIDPTQSTVTIDGRSSVHPIHAQTSGAEGWIDLDDDLHLVGGSMSLPVALLRSGNPLEDRELQRRIDARRYPTIEGVITAVNGRLVSGDVTFRGVTRNRAEEMTVTRIDNETVRLEGEATFDIREYGMQPPRILMLRVEPEVRVRISLVGRALAE
jgi:polyisoprenoid-binding protein YceI